MYSFWSFACIVLFVFSHDYCIVMLNFDLLFLFTVITSPSFPIIVLILWICICNIIYYCARTRFTQFWCSHTSVYVYIVHMLLLTNIDCIWFKYRKVLFIRPRDHQIVYLRNKSWKPECVESFNMDWRILVFYPEPEARGKIY